MSRVPTLFSFVRGGERKLAVLDAHRGRASPTEIWTDAEGRLLTVCDGEVVAGPVTPRVALLYARAVALGAAPDLSAINEMALLLLALQAKEGQP